MQILYPAAPGRKVVDSGFETERDIAKSLGFPIAYADTDMHFGADITLSGIEPGPVLYRGWLLKQEDYERLESAVETKGGVLHTTNRQYEYACNLPQWYTQYQNTKGDHWVTPASDWFPEGTFEDDLRRVTDWISESREGSAIVKDYLKSRKHEWFDACFIRDVKDKDEVFRVANNFLERQKSDGSYRGGLVFRKFEKFKQIGVHPKSRLPLVNEWRQFYFNGEPMYQAPYWLDGADYKNCKEPTEVLKGLKSKFCAVDWTEREDGTFALLEINDGGTAGCPEGGNLHDFYKVLKDRSS